MTDATPYEALAGARTDTELWPLVSGAEIARRLGLSRERVRQLARREDFPDPIGRVGVAIVWRWPDVEAWAERTGRLSTEAVER